MSDHMPSGLHKQGPSIDEGGFHHRSYMSRGFSSRGKSTACRMPHRGNCEVLDELPPLPTFAEFNRVGESSAGRPKGSQNR